MRATQHVEGQAMPDEAPSALQLDNDLFFAVKVADTLKHAGYATRTARTAADFASALAASRPTVALVHIGARGLDWRAALRAAGQGGVPVVAYGSHVDTAAQEEARALGATSVIANSKLASDLIGVVRRTLSRAEKADADAGAPQAAEGNERETGDA